MASSCQCYLSLLRPAIKELSSLLQLCYHQWHLIQGISVPETLVTSWTGTQFFWMLHTRYIIYRIYINRFYQTIIKYFFVELKIYYDVSYDYKLKYQLLTWPARAGNSRHKTCCFTMNTLSLIIWY